SFVELGYLPMDQLFTTILGQSLGLRVANFGTSYTGPLTQLSYLQDYGIAQSTRRSVIVFFEGNDLSDLSAESADAEKLKLTGKRPYRKFTKQPSAIKAAYNLFLSMVGKQVAPSNLLANAYFFS